MQFRDLGPLAVEVDGFERRPPGPKPAALLSVLLMHVTRRVPVPALLAVLWGDQVPDRAEATLESHVWRLRRMLEPSRVRGEPPSVLVNDSGGYRLLVRTDQVDSLRFEQLADEARGLTTAGDPERALARCEEALGLWRGAPYQQVADQEWAAPLLARLEELGTEVRQRRLDALLAIGDNSRALVEAAAMTERNPFRERLWGQRMLALYRAGRAEEALQTYRRARSLLVRELGAEPGTELQDLHRRVLAQDPALLLHPGLSAGRRRPEAPPALAEATATTTEVTQATGQEIPRRPEMHLPVRGYPLVGRDDDVRRLRELVPDRRLVTLAGAAGCGKTRLAVEVASAVADRFPDGVWFVDLTAVEQPEQVLDMVTSSIGLAAPVVGTGLDALRSYTRDRQMLVLLDNCEHLLSGVADVIPAVLSESGHCAILATSREPLDVAGEVIWSLGPLSLEPDTEISSEAGALDAAAPDTDGAAASPAVELFLARMHEADPTHPVTGEVMPVVAEICRAVDGIPLAIELAAARVRSATLAEIAAQVSVDASGLRRLGRGPTDHRQSVRSAIEWSHRLLSLQEQVVHRRLSVLTGPFPRGAAAAVAGADPVDAADVPELLAVLAHRSLLTPVRARRPGGPTLFNQLATVRGHAGHALTAHDETAAAARRRDDWVTSLLEGRPRLSQPGRSWYDAVDDAYPTVRTTLQHLLVDQRSPAGVRLLSRLTMFWYYRTRTLEARRWLQLALALPDLDPIDAAHLHLTVAAHDLLRGRADLAGPHLVTAVEVTHAAPADRLIDVAELMGTVALAAETQQEHDHVALLSGAVDELAARAEDNGLRALASALGLLVTPAPRLAGNGHAVEDLYRQAVASGDLLSAWVVATVGSATAEAPRDGIRWTDRQADLQVRLGSADSDVFAERRAGFMFAADDVSGAVRLWAASRTYLRRVGIPWPLHPDTRRLVRQAQSALGTEQFDRAWGDGEHRRVGS